MHHHWSTLLLFNIHQRLHCCSAKSFCFILTRILALISVFSMTMPSVTESFKRTGSLWIRHRYLIAVPISEEVDGSIFSPLDKRPAASVHVMLTPGLYRRLRPIRLQKIRPAGGVSSLHRLKTVPKGTLRHQQTQMSERMIQAWFNVLIIYI